MKTLGFAIALVLVPLQDPASAQTWIDEVEAARRVQEAREVNVGADETSVLNGVALNDLRKMTTGEDTLAKAREWATIGPPPRSSRRGRWLREHLDHLKTMNRLSVALRAFRYAPVDEPWVEDAIRRQSDAMEEVAADLCRSVTGEDPEGFDYEADEFAAKRIDERSMLLGVLAARTVGQLVEALRADAIDVAEHREIVSRLNLVWELSRDLQEE